MNDNETPQERRHRQIAASRAALAAAYEADPDAVKRFEARKANIDAVRRRERQRFEHLVIGKPRPKAKETTAKRRGKRKVVAVTREVLEPGIEEAVALREEWSHKAKGTPQTWEYAERTHQGALAQLHLNGSINDDQLAWAAEIGKAAEAIEHDVDVRTASMEARVDTSPGPGDFVGQRIAVVRLHVAYTYWRHLLPAPKRLVLDMLIGDPIGFSVAARRHHVHKRKAKRELIAALDRWPVCKDRAYRDVSEDDVVRLNDLIVGIRAA